MYIRTRVHTYTPAYTRGCEYKTPSLPANGLFYHLSTGSLTRTHMSKG